MIQGFLLLFIVELNSSLLMDQVSLQISCDDNTKKNDIHEHDKETVELAQILHRIMRIHSFHEGHQNGPELLNSNTHAHSFHALFPDHMNEVAKQKEEQKEIEISSEIVQMKDKNSRKVIRIQSCRESHISASSPRSSKFIMASKGDPSTQRHAQSFHVMFPNQPEWEMEVRTERRRLPFLMRFHAGHFRICLGLAAQTVLFKELSNEPFSPIKAPWWGMLALWIFALLVLVVMCGIYITKCVKHMDIVKMEYQDKVRVNYLFVPWICAMILTMGFPGDIKRAPDVLHRVLWWVFMVPVATMEVKLYGQWFTKGKTFLSRIANPSTHLSVIGNFVGARMAAHAGWGELAMFFYTVGIVHYLVLFITLYQRLPTTTALSKKNHPVFFLFIAAPSVSAVAWQDICGSFSIASKLQFFLSLFLYSALMVRVKFFKQAMQTFNVAWWAYAYPMTAVGIASVRYAQQQHHAITKILALVLSVSAMAAVFMLVAFTLIDMVFWRRGLFPNDILIVSTQRRRRRKITHNKNLDISSKVSDTAMNLDSNMSFAKLMKSISLNKASTIFHLGSDEV